MKVAFVVFAVGLSVGCGVIGPPIPPEDVGVAPTIERQQRRDAAEAAKREAAEPQAPGELQGQDIDLPPLRPIGGR